MNDEEYRQWLLALARKHLRPTHQPSEWLSAQLEQLSSLARFAKAINDRADNSTLVQALANELHNSKIDPIIYGMDIRGVLAALDDVPEVTFGELRRSAIPDEDVHLLARAGIIDAEAEVATVIRYAHHRLGLPVERPSEIAYGGVKELGAGAERLHQFAGTGYPSPPESPPSPEKKRKTFNGIGKILAGAVTAAGNLLMFTGTVVAPNPATAYGLIGSSALAVSWISQGIGDLRGE